ncbi:hypothetical protein Pelo_219 [Pelomyxa schiedti]|nr:hypothetical protein Pelo_219 [Pelomyxa schiedti]
MEPRPPMEKIEGEEYFDDSDDSPYIVQRVGVITAHREGIISLDYKYGMIATGSMDKTARITSLDGFNCLQVLPHTEWVSIIRIITRTTLVTASLNKLKVWDIPSGTPLFEFSVQPNAPIISLSHTRRKIAIGDWKSTLTVLDFEAGGSGTCVTTQQSIPTIQAPPQQQIPTREVLSLAVRSQRYPNSVLVKRGIDFAKKQQPDGGS